MNINMRMFAIVVAASFVSGAFLASPELRAYAADTIGSIDIIDGSIMSEDIGTGQVKSPDIASNAIVSTKIKDGTIQERDLADAAVTSNKLGPDVFDAMQAQIDDLMAENAAQDVEIDDLKARVAALEGGGPDPNDVDNDLDGFTENGGDCDDTNAALNPDATEVQGNGVDDDCDGTVDEAAPTITQTLQSDTTIFEGEATHIVTIFRSGDLTGTSTVDFTTVDGTATSPSDYTSVSGTLTYLPGVDDQAITIAVVDDFVNEGITPEEFDIVFSNCVGCTIDPQSVQVTILLVSDE